MYVTGSSSFYHIISFLSFLLFYYFIIILYLPFVANKRVHCDISDAADSTQQIPVTVRGSPSRGFDVEYITRTPGSVNCYDAAFGLSLIHI